MRDDGTREQADEDEGDGRSSESSSPVLWCAGGIKHVAPRHQRNRAAASDRHSERVGHVSLWDGLEILWGERGNACADLVRRVLSRR